MTSEKRTPTPVQAGLMGKCPRCGEGRLFSGVLTLGPACPKCHLDYAFIDTGDGPAVFAIFVLGVVVLGGALWFEFTFNPALWIHVVLWGIVTPVLAIGLLRVLKGTLTGLQYANKAEEHRLDTNDGGTADPHAGDGGRNDG
ncbi:MAG: DUF983 domain-containing protein [Pseudomonadota bacterium]